MAKNRQADFLAEVGTEELPPKALKSLMEAFTAGMAGLLDEHRLEHGELRGFASPRRLAVLVRALSLAQADRSVALKGPAVSVAFGRNGKATPAAQAFARKCGVDVEALGREKTAKGEWLMHRAVHEGEAAAKLLPGIVQKALDQLPIPRRMRWGVSDAEFVRPVHWVVLVHGSKTVEGRVLGIQAGNRTRGHRFLAPQELTIGSPDQYLAVLEKKGFVLADFAARRRRIVEIVDEAARQAGGSPGGDLELFDEVTALNEWPVAISGAFDEAFLSLPREVVVATLTGHQRYFPVIDKDGRLLPAFICIANIDSREPQRVKDGNERVIRPRLADAAFFWEADRRRRLADRIEGLENVVYQQGLGSIADRSLRIAALAAELAERTGAAAATVDRAARLAKCDLLTGMVGEFPELQGIMGRHYAMADGEPEAVALAIGEQYLPRHAGDRLPDTPGGRTLAIADKLDALAGVFALGKRPTGNRDPFGLRRAALGLARIVVDGQIDCDLLALLDRAVTAQPVATADTPALVAEIYDFIVERLRAWYLERPELTVEMFESVRARKPASLLDFDQRLKAVAAFARLDDAASLAAANKRIGNILRQAGEAGETGAEGTLDPGKLSEPAEQRLHAAMQAAKATLAPLVAERAYTEALTALAALREPVDGFFDDVMVMSEDQQLRKNRLALLAELRGLFLDIADVSRLSIG